MKNLSTAAALIDSAKEANDAMATFEVMARTLLSATGEHKLTDADAQLFLNLIEGPAGKVFETVLNALQVRRSAKVAQADE